MDRLTTKDHIVQLYVGDRELADAVADHLLEALGRSGVAVMVATPEHLCHFEQVLAGRGVDVETAKARGALLSLDATATLERFVVGGRPDPGRFQEVIASLLDRPLAAGRPVRVFGEMVALLWAEGHVNTAIEVERLWGDLGRQRPFALLCAYAAEQMGGRPDAFAEMCSLHSAVLGAPVAEPVERSRTFSPGPEAPTMARRFALAALREFGAEELEDDLGLIVTELATNAVLHAGTTFTVALAFAGPLLRVGVADGSGVLPTLRGHSATRLSGRGLTIVAAVAEEWGASATPAGKVVWAALRR